MHSKKKGGMLHRRYNGTVAVLMPYKLLTNLKRANTTYASRLPPWLRRAVSELLQSPQYCSLYTAVVHIQRQSYDVVAFVRWCTVVILSLAQVCTTLDPYLVHYTGVLLQLVMVQSVKVLLRPSTLPMDAESW